MSLPGMEKQHVTRTPGVCGGKPCVAGTRIRVWDVYQWHELAGWTAAEIIAHFPQLTLADVHGAMAYFWDHEAEIRLEMKEAKEFVDQMRGRAGPSKLDHNRQLKRDGASTAS